MLSEKCSRKVPASLSKKKNEDAIAVDAADMYFTVTFLNV